MSIELSRTKIGIKVRSAVTERLVQWRREDKSEVNNLATLITEIMWEVAAMTKQSTAERGILAGVKMLETWED